MRQRINHGTIITTMANIGPANDFFRQFGEQFRVLLNPDTTNRHFLKTVYVRNTPAANDIQLSLEANDDSCHFLLGPIGIGKSTLIYNELDVLPSRPKLTTDTITVLIDCEPTTITIAPTTLSNYVEPICDMLEKQMNLFCTEEDIFDFAWSNKPSIITTIRTSPRQSKKEIMQLLYSTNRRAFVMEWLKLLLNKDQCTITNVVFILDNIEAIREWTTQAACVKEILELHECLKNNPGRKYSVNSLISVRPDSARQLSKDPSINTYSIGKPVILENTPPLDELFRQRFDALLKSKYLEHQNSEKWKNAYNVLVNVSKGLSLRDADQNLISRLCNYDLGATLVNFDRILANRIYIQKGFPVTGGAFEVRRSQFTTDEIPFLKAVIYGNAERYHNAEDALVQNVLNNVEDAEYDLIPLLLMNYFRANAEKGCSADFQYSHINPLLASVDGLLPWADAGKYMKQTIDWFCERCLLCESPWSKEGDPILALTPRCTAIIDLLQMYSFALEAFREDLWLNHPAQCMKPTVDLSESERWRASIEVVLNYQRAEHTLLESIVNAGATRKYVSIFGNASLSAVLYKGVEHSYYAHYSEDREGRKHDFFNAKNWHREISALIEKEFSHE